jgi:hypothetical protein
VGIIDNIGNSSTRFISFTKTEEEISILLDGQTLSGFPKDKLEVILPQDWVPIKRVGISFLFLKVISKKNTTSDVQIRIY